MRTLKRPCVPAQSPGALITAVVIITGLTIAGSPASAQTFKQVDVSGGYLNVNGLMHGANVQVGAQVSPHVSLVGEFDSSTGADCGGCDPTYHDMAVLGGIRYGWFPTRRVSPFWQVLAGGLHSRAEQYYAEYCCGIGRELQRGYTVDYLALQPGGGVTVMVTPRVGIRGQVDLQFAIPDQRQWEGMSIFPRTAIGAVIRLGSGR